MENKTNNAGLACPSCAGNIKFTFEDLLLKNKITCPFCRLQMDMNVPSSIKHHLQEIKIAEQQVQAAKTFSK